MRTRPSDPVRRIRRPGFFDGNMMPSLMLDFAAGVLDQRITFTRTTSGTYYKNGLVTTASANVPRFQSDPVTGESQGLLIENGATNLVCGSETFATSGGANNWTDSNITRDGTLRTSPDGTTNALRIAAAAGNATVLNNLALTSAARTFSVWIRRVSGTGNIDLTMDGGTAWTTQSVTASWMRFQMTATTTAHVGIRIVDAADEIEIWGAQVEAQILASSYIPTTIATVARGADSASMTGTNFSSWYNRGEGTILCRGFKSSYNATDLLCVLHDGTTSNRWQFGATAAPLMSSTLVASGSTQATLTSAIAAVPSARYAVAIKTDNVAASFNGGAPATDATATMPALTTLDIGMTTLSIGGTRHWNGTIHSLAYWPIRLSNQALQILAT